MTIDLKLLFRHRVA